jgi:deoxycytidylate deaminase
MHKWTKREQSHMRFATELAKRSTCNMRHGCAIFNKNQHVGNGWNKDKTHPAAAACYSQCIHAELAAVIMTDERHLEGSDIFVARVMRRKGQPLGISKPCRECTKMIRNARIRKVYYTTQDGSWTMERV